MPANATMSREVDIAVFFSATEAESADVISLHAGELSPFHETHGFYLEGVQRETAILPEGWEYRLVSVRNENTRNATGLCLEPHDLCASKLMAHREKDLAFVLLLIKAELIQPELLVERLQQVDINSIESDQDTELLEMRKQASVSWVESLP